MNREEALESLGNILLHIDINKDSNKDANDTKDAHLKQALIVLDGPQAQKYTFADAYERAQKYVR